MSFFRKKRASRRDIIRWLRSANKDCKDHDIYKDPGYSEYYKDYTSIYDDDLMYRGKHDIDLRIWHRRIPYYENIYEKEDDMMEDFVDHVKSNMTDEEIGYFTEGRGHDEKEYMEDKLRYMPILIPPGTNHSNANVLYKLLQSEILEYTRDEPFSIASFEDMNYDGSITELEPYIDKKIIYRFCYENSDHYK